MHRNSVASTLLTLSMFAVPCATGASGAEPIPWTDRADDAMAEARESGRPVVVDLWAVWCAPCKTMDETTYRDPAVVDAMASFVPLKIDVDAQATFVERYEVEVFPTVLFLDERGRELGRMEGLVRAPALLERMRAVGEGYHEYLEAVEDRRSSVAQTTAARYLVATGNAREAGERLRWAEKRLRDSDPPERRDEIELLRCRAMFLDGEHRGAAKGYRKLAEDAATPDLRARALAGLVEVERRRGRDDQAAAAAARLRRDHPDRAGALLDGASD